jgi:hypothetical protein
VHGQGATDAEAVAHLASQAQQQIMAVRVTGLVRQPRTAKEVDVQDYIRAFDLSADASVVMARFSLDE